MRNLDSANPNIQRNPAPQAAAQNTPQSSSVNLISAKQKSAPKRFLRKILTFIVLVIIILAGYVFIRAANLSQKIFVGQKTTFWGKVAGLFGGDNQTLIGEDLGQVNVLLLGIGGEGHDGPYLTDTMILAQIRPDKNQVTLTSIPRDYYVNLPQGAGQSKINEAFSDGYLKKHDFNQGGEWAEQVVENISGLKIPYFAIMDFSGFEKAVNQVGGLDITVQNTFTDYTYPDSGTGYLPPQTFTAGPAHLDGAKALIFARSRHAAGDEGSDFARGLRQQKIIEAFKQKALGMNLISDAGNINSLLGTFADHFHTNMNPSEILRIYNLFKGKQTNILSLSLDPETGIICPEILASTGAYVLTPCAGKSEQSVKDYFQNSFSIGKLTSEKSIVWLGNSTTNSAAYKTAFRKLTDAGLIVYQLNYSKDNLPHTTIYQANPKPATDEFIKNILHATEANIPPPGVTVDKNKVDVIVVLGENAPVEAEPTPYIPPPARIPTTTTTTISSLLNSTSTPVSTSTATSTKNTKK